MPAYTQKQNPQNPESIEEKIAADGASLSPDLSPAAIAAFPHRIKQRTDRRTFVRSGLATIGYLTLGGQSALANLPAAFGASAAKRGGGPKRIYIGADDHTDYMWSADEDTYKQAFLEMLDYYLAQMDATAANPSDYQARWNCDGSFWLWTFEKSRSLGEFESKIIPRLADGHLSAPLTTLVGCYGGTPTEAVLRGLYYAGRLERRYNLRFRLAVAMENQTMPYGLGSLWAGSGAKYSWRGVCNCATRTPNSGDREFEIYWWVGPDNSKILMKWNSLYAVPQLDPQYSQYYANYPVLYGGYQDPNENMGGYAEARYPFELVDFVDTNAAFQARYPYQVIGAFGQGWDQVKTLSNIFPIAAQMKSNANRRVIVSNETDFFQDFETTYPTGIPTQSVTFGNEWELSCATMTEVTATVRRATEKLRGAEAMATLVSKFKTDFMDSRVAARDQAFVNLGLYWEHDFVGGGPVPNADRAAWQRRTAQGVTDYVNTLQTDALAALGGLIGNPGTTTYPRFFVFNPLGWTRSDYTDLPYAGPYPAKAVDIGSNKEAPSQRYTAPDGQSYLRIQADNVPSIGYRVYEVQPVAGAAFPPAATVSANNTTLDNAYIKVVVSPYGAVTSLTDKGRGNRQLAKQVNGGWLNDLGASGGTLTVENAGPVSVTLKATAIGPTVPWDHITRITLFKGSRRVELHNIIQENMTQVVNWGYGFNLNNPDIHFEEVGAIIRGKLLAQGGHYSPRNARYDWASFGHFADITAGDNSFGATLSNADCHFFRIGNSDVGTLDTATPFIGPLAGGQIDSGQGVGGTNQDGDSYFLQRFALGTHAGYDPTNAMRFALEHQNPLIGGAVTGGKNTAVSPLSSTTYSLFRVTNANLLLWAIKPAEEGINQGIIARVWNVSVSAVSGSLSLSKPITAARRVTHIETDISAVPISSGSASVSLAAREMQTFRLT